MYDIKFFMVRHLALNVYNYNSDEIKIRDGIARLILVAGAGRWAEPRGATTCRNHRKKIKQSLLSSNKRIILPYLF